MADPCYLVQEIDGTSRFTLEDASGFLLLEFCPPEGGEELIAGGVLPLPGDLRELPVRRGRRRRLHEIITDEEEDMMIILFTIDN